MTDNVTRFTDIFGKPKASYEIFKVPIVRALGFLGNKAGFKLPPHIDKVADTSLKSLCRQCNLLSRPVELAQERAKTLPMPLLAILEDDTCVVLFSDIWGRLKVFDPVSNSKISMSAEIESNIAEVYSISPLFPQSKLSLRQFLSFSLMPNRLDILMLTTVGLIGAMLAMAAPYAMGLVFSKVVPGAMRSELTQIVLAMSLVALVIFVLDRSTALLSLRVQGRVSNLVTGALWQRLLQFPNDFFSRFGPGDILQRLTAAQRIHSMLQHMLSTGIVRLQHMMVSLVMMGFYYPMVAALSFVLSLLLFGLCGAAVYAQRKASIEGEAFNGNAYNQSIELLNGVSKIKAAGAQSWAFNQWAHNFAALQSRSLRSRSIGNKFNAIAGVTPTLMLVIVFVVIGAPDMSAEPQSVGHFMAFITALGTYSASVVALCGLGMQISPLIGQGKRLLPFLETEPQSEKGRVSCGQLSGAVALQNVSFQYGDGMPYVFENLSIDVKPGEFLAIVGDSGCGKSTLVKLLLGSLIPQTGSILFDNKDRQTLYSDELSEQVAAVLQFSQLMPGSLLDNIRGTGHCTLEEAWQAAEVAGLADEIRNLPMGMQTQITQGGSTFSGGQQQRMMIARAIAAKPKILILDEATSALDEPTQAKVVRALDELPITRIVVAHRLSTIKHADRIVLLHQGKIAESGSFEELMALNGAFAQLYR